MQLADAISIVDKSRSPDGYMRVRARSARSGIYDYLGIEVDPQGKRFKPNDVVKVYRPDAEVFDKASLASFIAKPITNDHPSEAVTAANWRDHARGAVFGAVKDGEYVGFDLAFMDAATIADIEAGKRELSNGYSCDLAFESGKTPDGITFDAIQRNIRGNHVAVVDRGRAGSECRIADQAPWATCDALPAIIAELSSKEPAMAGNIIVDGLPVSLADENAVRAVIAKKDEAIATAETGLADANAKLTTEQGKVTALEAQLADAKKGLEPAALDKLVADRGALIAQAKAVKPDLVTDGKTDAEIRREVVAAKLGDRTPTEDAAIAGAFAVLTADAAPAATVQNINPAMRVSDGAATRDAIRAARYA